MPEADVFGYMDVRGRPILFAEKSTSPPPGVTPFAVTSKTFSPSPVDDGATVTWTITGTARSDGAEPTVGAVADTAGNTWTVASRTTTQVVLTATANGSGSVSVSVPIDGVSVSGTYTITNVTPPSPTKYVGKWGWTDDAPLASVAGDSQVRKIDSTTWVAGDVGWAVDKGMRVVHLNIGMRELVNVNATTYATTYKTGSIETAIARVRTWNTANPTRKVSVALRMHVGERAPAAWGTVCGTVLMSDEGFGKVANVPRWWGDAAPYRKLYRNAMRAVASAVKGIPEIISVNVPGAAHFYPEPFIVLPTSKASESATKTNRDILVEAGWTPEQHKAFLRWLPSTVAVFERVVVYLAINPLNTGGAGGLDAKINREVAEAHIAALEPGQAGIENYSMREQFTLAGKGDYWAMYKWMGTMAGKAWLCAQLARTPRVCDNPVTEQVWDKIGAWAISEGFHAIETSGPARNNKAGQLCVANAWADEHDAYHDNAAVFAAQNNDFRLNPAPTGS